MKEYKIELSEEENITASDGATVNEVGLCLQIYQDLVKMKPEHAEDALIMKILEQVLSEEFDGVENIDFPDYYTPKGQRVESEVKKESGE